MSSYDSYMYQSDTPSLSDGQAAGLFIGIILVSLVIVLIIYVVYSIFLGMVFKKAGIEAWKAWVPIYNNWVMLEMGGQQGWLSLLSLVPGGGIVTAIFLYIAMYHISIKFGKDGVLFTLIAVFAGPVWAIWLALDKTAVWNSGKHPTHAK